MTKVISLVFIEFRLFTLCVCASPRVRASVWKHVNWIGNWETLCRNFWGKLNLKEMKKKKKITKNDQSTIYFWYGIFQKQLFEYIRTKVRIRIQPATMTAKKLSLFGNTCALVFWGWNKKWVISIKSWKDGNKPVHIHAHMHTYSTRFNFYEFARKI